MTIFKRSPPRRCDLCVAELRKQGKSAARARLAVMGIKMERTGRVVNFCQEHADTHLAEAPPETTH